MEQNQTKGSGMAIASLVLGIVAIVTSLLWFIAIPAGVLAIIFGILTIKSNKGKALAGLITGAVGILFSIAIIVLAIIATPILQETQRDTYRKNDLSKLSNQITAYSISNRGELPTVDMMGADDLTVVQSIVGSGAPTTDKAVFTPGENCEGKKGPSAFALRIALESSSGIDYCVDR